MSRWLGLALVCWLAAAGAAQSAEVEPYAPQLELPFWSISTADFYPDTPRPLSVPGTDGRLEYYWYWTFTFRYKTNLEVLTEYFRRMEQELNTRAAPSETQALNKTIERLQATIKKIDTDGNLPAPSKDDDQLVEQLRWRMAMFITLRDRSGKVMPDLRSGVIRNLIERKEGKKLYTVDEIQRLQKKDIPETFDLDHGKGQWVTGVAVFQGLPLRAREFEVRIVGMGQRLRPNFIPGRLIYTPRSTGGTAAGMDMSSRPLLRRAMRFFYHKIGESGEPQLDRVTLTRRTNDWLWVWALQFYPGCFRTLDLTRDPELSDVPPLTRRYVYFPYFIWNNTGGAHELKVKTAGLFADVNLGGEKVRVLAVDDGGMDARWKDQAEAAIRRRLHNGEERKFVEENEEYPITYERIDVKEYYKTNYPELEYVPENSSAQEKILNEEQKKVNDELFKELEIRKAADLNRKANFTVKKPRLFAAKIENGQVVNGVAIVRWGVTNLDAVINELLISLHSSALLAAPAEDGTLLAEYQKLRGGYNHVNAGLSTMPAEPSVTAATEMLVKFAEKELTKLGVKIGGEDVTRYGAVAPLGTLLNALAWEKINNRVDERAVIDTYYQVEVDGSPDDAFVTARYQLYSPEAASALPVLPDSFSEESMQSGALFQDIKDDNDNKEDEDAW